MVLQFSFKLIKIKGGATNSSPSKILFLAISQFPIIHTLSILEPTPWKYPNNWARYKGWILLCWNIAKTKSERDKNLLPQTERPERPWCALYGTMDQCCTCKGIIIKRKYVGTHKSFTEPRFNFIVQML